MVAKIQDPLYCENCGAEATMHARNLKSGADRHFCSQACFDKIESQNDSDETHAFYHSGQAPGAIPNGTRVKKVVCESGDGHPIGSTGVVLGSVGPGYIPQLGREAYGYWVEWDEDPGKGIPCFVGDHKIAPEGKR